MDIQIPIEWIQTTANENLFRCIYAGIQIGWVLKSDKPLVPNTKCFGCWANDGTFFTNIVKAQAHVITLATKHD